MEYATLIFFFFPMIINLGLTISQEQLCSNNGIYSSNSTYSKNLNTVLSFLPLNTTNNGGFYNATAGHEPDKVYALGLCRGDLSSNSCYDCINSSIQGIIKQCPNQKEAIMWGEELSTSQCTVRYSNSNIFDRMQTSPSVCVPNPNNMTEKLDQFNQTLNDLMAKLTTQASSGSSDLKFATGDESFTSSDKVFGLAQCSPDISQANCSMCLQDAIREMGECGGRKQGGRVLKPSCILWFELFKFYDSRHSLPSSPTSVDNSAPPDFSPPSTSTKGNTSRNTRNVILITVPVVILVILMVLACAIFRRRMSKHRVENDEMERVESLQFNLSTIKIATDDFSDANKLGQGGFGSVYKGMLPNGQEIAAKRLSGYSAQGEKEFKNEILLMAKLQHRNLVSLLGFCSEGTERILVYEIMRNGSLDSFIFDEIMSTQLNWEMRHKIIYGIARGIRYLHEESCLQIIHRDLKANNVLLDEEMNPKISDFGMARLFVLDQTHVITSRVAGTYGYIAPEYALQNRFSAKSDVFSFGVLVLEIVSGKRNGWLTNSGYVEHLLSHAWRNWRNGTASNLIDNALSPTSEIMRCIQIGLLCVQENAAHRPTMASVILMLSTHSITLPQPSQPAFLMYSNTDSDMPPLEPHSLDTLSDQSTLYMEATTH